MKVFITVIIAQWSLSSAQTNSFANYCTSESDFNADTTFSYFCKGTNGTACQDAGGMHYNDLCYNIDTSTSTTCDAIGFNYEASYTCEEYSSTFNPSFLSCSDSDSLYTISLIHTICCGGVINNKDICPNTILPDPCSACDVNDKNLEQPGISNECFADVVVWGYQPANRLPDACLTLNPEILSTVSVECKSSLFSTCSDPPIATTSSHPTFIPSLQFTTISSSIPSVDVSGCEKDNGNKFKYLGDKYSCKQLNRLKKKHRKKICMRVHQANELCPVICKYKI